MSRERSFALSLAVLLTALAAVSSATAAENQVTGSLTVDGKPVALTHVYALAQKGFFDPKKQDVVVLFCDGEVPPPAVADDFARRELVRAGKLHCVRQTIDADKQVINYAVETDRFKHPEGGGSTEHVFEAKTFDGKTAAGHSWTRSPQKSFDDVPYAYDVTFTAGIEPKK